MNWHNRKTLLYTKYVRNTKNYFPLDLTKLTQDHNSIVLWVRMYVVCKTKTYFPPEPNTDTTHNWKKGSSSPHVASVFFPPSLILSVSKGEERDVE
jgi:hypothetical protein